MLKESVERCSHGRTATDTFEQRHQCGAAAAAWSGATMAALRRDSACSPCPSPKPMVDLAAARSKTMIVDGGFRSRALALEPYLATVVSPAAACVRCIAARAARWLPSLSRGTGLFAFAHAERTRATTRACRNDGTARRRLAGSSTAPKRYVLHGDCADQLIVSARVSGGRCRRPEASHCSSSMRARRVCSDAAIRRRTGCAPRKSSFAVKVPAHRHANWLRPAQALATIEHVVDAAIAALCAEAVGVCSAPTS